MSPRLDPRRGLAALATAGLLLGAPAAAQDANRAVIGAPTVTTYQIGTGETQRTVSQTTMPIVVLLPISQRFNMDLSTAFATSGVQAAGVTTSRISGLTDTQLRGNLILGEIRHILIDDSLYQNGRIDFEKLDPVGRLAGNWYSTIRDRFELQRG